MMINMFTTSLVDNKMLPKIENYNRILLENTGHYKYSDVMSTVPQH